MIPFAATWGQALPLLLMLLLVDSLPSTLGLRVSGRSLIRRPSSCVGNGLAPCWMLAPPVDPSSSTLLSRGLTIHKGRRDPQEEDRTSDGPADYNYNDDAFGLVFLSGALVAQDALFSAIFLGLSAAAALAAKQRPPEASLPNPAAAEWPAAVAGIALLTNLGISTMLEGYHHHQPPPLTMQASFPISSSLLDLLDALAASKLPTAPWIELVVCSISMVYGFVFLRNKS